MNNTNLTSATLLIDRTNSAVNLVSPLLIEIIVAILIFLIGFVIGKLVEKILSKLFETMELDKLISKKTGFKLSTSEILSKGTAYFIYIISIVTALNTLNIATEVITTITILIIILLIFFIVFGLNDVFANLFAGLLIRFRHNLEIGNHIKIKDKNVDGIIEEIGMLNIRIETDKDETVFVPNMAIFKSEIVKIKKIKEEKNVSKE